MRAIIYSRGKGSLGIEKSLSLSLYSLRRDDDPTFPLACQRYFDLAFDLANPMKDGGNPKQSDGGNRSAPFPASFPGGFSESRLLGTIPCADPARIQEILAESLNLALTSANLETSRSRFELARECFRELSERPLFDGAFGGLKEAFARAVRDFPTVHRANAIRRLLGLAEKAKRSKTKLKYLQEAQRVAREGLDDPTTRKDELESLLAAVSKEALLVNRSVGGDKV